MEIEPLLICNAERLYRFTGSYAPRRSLFLSSFSLLAPLCQALSLLLTARHLSVIARAGIFSLRFDVCQVESHLVVTRKTREFDVRSAIISVVYA